MKYLLVITVVLVGFWIWRNNRQGERADTAAPPAPRAPARMVACRHCGTHLPESEQLTGQHGAYCCPEHRQLAEGPSR